MRHLENTGSLTKSDKDKWLESVMEQYGERLTRLAYNYLKDWNMAQDVVQEVFVTCYKKYDHIAAVTSFKPWLYRVTINRCKDVLKSASVKKVIVNNSLFQFFSSKDASPESEIVKRNEQEELSLTVLALPVKYREIIILYYYEELSIEEIKNLLGLNANTVKTRLSRGREKLRKALEGGERHG